MLNPGESFPQEAPVSSATPDPTSAAEPSASASKSSTGSSKHDLSAGVIAGIVVATVVVIFAGILIFFSLRWLKTKSQHNQDFSSSQALSPVWSPNPPEYIRPESQFIRPPPQELPGEKSW
jgi:hypothetical protein